MAQETAPELEEERHEGIVQGDEPDETVEKFLEELREESRAWTEDTAAETTDESRVVSICIQLQTPRVLPELRRPADDGVTVSARDSGPASAGGGRVVKPHRSVHSNR